MTTPPIPPSDAPVLPGEHAVRISRWAGYMLAALLGIGLISCVLLFFRGKVDVPTNLSVDSELHGEITHRIAKQLSKAWFAEQAANLERGTSWLLLHDTGSRVREGCPDWLFLTDELKINHQAQANAETKAHAVIDLQQQLRQRGIRLLVAVVPDKSRIAAEQLCGIHRPMELTSRAVDWIATLQQAGVQTINLATTLQPLGASAYLRTDTHWSETGAKAAAQVIAQQVNETGIQPTPQKTFDTHTAAPERRPGDLVRLAGIDWLPLNLQPKPEIVAATEVTEKQQTAQSGGDNLDDLFGDDNLPNVALIGTSFSRNSNFVGFLQLALGAPVGSFAKDGGEFSGGANDYFSNPAFRQTPPKLLIWEIPERDLQTPYVPISLDK